MDCRAIRKCLSYYINDPFNCLHPPRPSLPAPTKGEIAGASEINGCNGVRKYTMGIVGTDQAYSVFDQSQCIPPKPIPIGGNRHGEWLGAIRPVKICPAGPSIPSDKHLRWRDSKSQRYHPHHHPNLPPAGRSPRRQELRGESLRLGRDCFW